MVRITSLTVDVPLFSISLFIYLFLLCVNSAKILLKRLMALSVARINCHWLPAVSTEDIRRAGPRTNGSEREGERKKRGAIKRLTRLTRPIIDKLFLWSARASLDECSLA